MNKENNHRTQILFNKAFKIAFEDQETLSTVNNESDFSQFDARLLPYHLYFSFKL